MTHDPNPVILKVRLKPGFGPPGNIVEVECMDLWWKETIHTLRTEGVYWQIGRTNGDIEMGWVAPESIISIETVIHNGDPHV